jgi:hypothetical protein
VRIDQAGKFFSAGFEIFWGKGGESVQAEILHGKRGE